MQPAATSRRPSSYAEDPRDDAGEHQRGSAEGHAEERFCRGHALCCPDGVELTKRARRTGLSRGDGMFRMRRESGLRLRDPAPPARKASGPENGPGTVPQAHNHLSTRKRSDRPIRVPT